MKIRAKLLAGGALAAAILAPFTAGSASADISDRPGPLGAGEWDYQGVDVFTTQSKNFPSGGGNFKVCLSRDSKHGYYRMMEEDPWDEDEYVPSNTGYDDLGFYYPGDTDSQNCFVYRNLNRFRDGDNNQAEFYLRKWTGGNSTVKAYD
ncbi:hypothetical protein GWI34_24750 [Actinomadura sp. DSM 109109]|nr:hypothetical protein [Actinomadura lepetitiana]